MCHVARDLALTATLTLLAGMALPRMPGAHAQDLPAPGDGFTWERVGDRPINVEDLAFGPDSTLWATGSDGPYRLDLTAGFPGTWVFLDDSPFVNSLLVLGRGAEGDTLVTGTGGSTDRSVDGGASWEQVYDDGDDGLYEVPAGYPFAGTVLVGDRTGIAYSTDRAATFTTSVVPYQGTGSEAGAEDFVAFPPGSAFPGRILAAGRWGVNVSDDGGRTFYESGLWQAVYYHGYGTTLTTPPAVERPEAAVVGGPGLVAGPPDAFVAVTGGA